MALGVDASDELAYELAQTDYDAVERDGLRAAWTADDTAVVVEDVESGETRTYDGEDLVRAASDRDVENARNPADAPE